MNGWLYRIVRSLLLCPGENRRDLRVKGKDGICISLDKGESRGVSIALETADGKNTSLDKRECHGNAHGKMHK